MKIKKSYLTLFIGAFFLLTITVNAECVLGQNTLKDLHGALNIFKIVAPLLMLAYTIFDMIKLLASGINVEGKEAPPAKVVFQRFVKRLPAVVLLFALPALLNRGFIWAGIYDEDGYCDISEDVDATIAECTAHGGTWDIHTGTCNHDNNA